MWDYNNCTCVDGRGGSTVTTPACWEYCIHVTGLPLTSTVATHAHTHAGNFFHSHPEKKKRNIFVFLLSHSLSMSSGRSDIADWWVWEKKLNSVLVCILGGYCQSLLCFSIPQHMLQSRLYSMGKAYGIEFPSYSGQLEQVYLFIHRKS